MNIKKFLQECHEKEVIKKLTFYVVTSWLLIQVATSIWEPLGLPSESVTILIILLLIGFPINMYFLWVYHLKPLEPVKPKYDEQGNPIPKKFEKSAFKKMYFSSISAFSLISIIIILFVVDNKFVQKSNLPPVQNFVQDFNSQAIQPGDQIAILKFENHTQDTVNDILGKMAVDWISHGITENKVAQVISPDIVVQYETILKASLGPESENVDLLKDYLPPKKIIDGEFYIKNNELIFHCTIKTGDSRTRLEAFESSCSSDSPLECIEYLNQLVLGYLSTADKGDENLQEKPPKFEAYQYVQKAKENIDKSEIYLDFLNKAIEADINYFYPKILRVGHYYNEGEYKKADSVLQLIRPFSEKQKRQNNLIKLYQAVLDGEYDKIVDYLTFEYNFTPFDLETNYSLLSVTQQFINKPEDIDTLFNAIPALGLDVKDCLECEYRVFVKVLADIELENYKEAIDVLHQVDKELDSFYLKKHLLTAYARSGSLVRVDSILDEISLKENDDNIKKAYLFAGKELLMLQDTLNADKYLNHIFTISDGPSNRIDGFAHYYKRDYKAALPILLDINKKDPRNPDILTKIAVSYTLNSNEEQAVVFKNQLLGLSKDYQFGEVDYALAQFYAALDNEKEAFRHLLKTVSQGLRFKYDTYQNDPHFTKYRNEPDFEKVLMYWH